MDPQLRFDPCPQDLDLNGLYHKIVGPGLEALDFTFAMAGQHDHR